MAKFKGAVLSCKVCGSAFKVPPSRATTASYCSVECAAQQRMVGKRKRVSLTCVGCGAEFESVACHANRRKYCSAMCKNSDVAIRKVRSERFKGQRNPAWKGGRVRHSDGYIYARVQDHPFTSNGYVLEHRLVMERWLRDNDPESDHLVMAGFVKYLSPEIHVHHKDENKEHNAIGNLVCMTPTEHARHHNNSRPKRESS